MRLAFKSILALRAFHALVMAPVLSVAASSALLRPSPDEDRSERAAARERPPAGPSFEFRLPSRAKFALAEGSQALVAAAPQWLRAVPLRNPAGEVELGSRVVLELEAGVTLETLTAHRALKLARVVAPSLFILEAADARVAASEAAALAALPGVRTSYPVMRRRADLNGAYAARPNDPHFGPRLSNTIGQWYLENRDPATGASLGVDLNTRAAWPVSSGAGVTVAVADLGVELTHPELLPRALGAPHQNFRDDTTNGLPFGQSSMWAHGTAVAGLAVAEGNNRYGMVGVAPLARLASWVIFETNIMLVSDERLMDMYVHAPDQVAVQNHSWAHDGLLQEMPGPLEATGLERAIRQGRRGLGAVMVRSAGNDRRRAANANDDGYVNDPRVIAVAAVNQDGRAAYYSEPGACLLVAAPAGETNGNGLFSTDLTGANGITQFGFFPPYEYLWNFVFNSLGFSGTSAATPLISGVAALILGANPDLSYRDVQQILLLSARHFDLADPDLSTNAAGLRVSHNVGFGVPDAGLAVALAPGWPRRPPLTLVELASFTPQAIPDHGLELVITGEGIPPALTSVPLVPSLSPHPDTPTPAVPMAEVGLATNALATNLTGRAALIQRGVNTFAEKVAFAAQAGCAFAVVYNFATNSGSGCPGGDQLCAMGNTDFVPVPAVFIGHDDGVALSALFATNPTARAQLRLITTNYSFVITNPLICEHVGLRVLTDHPLRGDLRITLVSPQGTRSVLQRYGGDTNAGPVDWTYYTTHCFYESSVGAWRAEFSDEFAGNTGAVRQVSLLLRGVEILDTDADGLDDTWEQARLGTLAMGPRDDPDADGYNNAREQAMGTDPLAWNTPFELALALWDDRLVRLSWPATLGRFYRVWAGPSPNALTWLTNLSGRFPETEWFIPYTNSPAYFYRVRRDGQ